MPRSGMLEIWQFAIAIHDATRALFGKVDVECGIRSPSLAVLYWRAPRLLATWRFLFPNVLVSTARNEGPGLNNVELPAQVEPLNVLILASKQAPDPLRCDCKTARHVVS
jgi:hypothetical protein